MVNKNASSIFGGGGGGGGKTKIKYLSHLNLKI
jgi:hypothetical protein